MRLNLDVNLNHELVLRLLNGHVTKCFRLLLHFRQRYECTLAGFSSFLSGLNSFIKSLSILKSDCHIKVGLCRKNVKWIPSRALILLRHLDRLAKINKALLVLASRILKLGLPVTDLEL